MENIKSQNRLFTAYRLNMEIEDDFLIIPFLGSSVFSGVQELLLGNGRTCPQPRCNGDITRMFLEECDGRVPPTPIHYTQCIIELTSERERPCLPCVCNEICKWEPDPNNKTVCNFCKQCLNLYLLAPSSIGLCIG